MNLLLFSWGYIFLGALVILPAALYIGGKIMKVQYKKFTFVNCIWISVVADLLAGLVTDFNQWAALGVFMILLGVMIEKQFRTSNGALVIMVIITTAVLIGLNYLKSIILLNLLGIPS